MSNRRDIHDYLDGSLDPGREDELFKDIGSSEELRREFNEQYEIHRSAKKIVTAMSVPAAAREELFQKLEITNSPEIPLPVPGGSSLLKTSLYISTFVGVVIFGALQFTHQNTANFPSSVNTELVVKNDQVFKNKSEHTTAAFIDGKSFKNKGTAKSRSVFLKNSQPVQTGKQVVAKNADVAGNSQQIFRGILPVPPSHNEVLQTGEPLKTEFSLLSFAALEEFFEQPVHIQFRSDASFKNLSASALYEVSAVDKFGVEFGYEEFRQKYNLTIEDEKTEVSRLQQTPVFSIAYRRNVPEISFKNMTPFVQLNAGGTSEGGLLKSTVGVEIQALGTTNFIVGAETAAISFKKQNAWYFSQKVTAVFGVSVAF